MPDRTTGHVLGPPSAPDKPARTDYDADFYSWSMEQARLLREARWAEVDRDNVAEEIESLGREQFSKLQNALRVILIHILKWDHQPTRRSRSWILSIETQRLEIKDILADNSGLTPRIQEAITRAYRRARIETANETGLETKAFPEECSYGFGDIMQRQLGL